MCERGENISQKKYAIFGVKTAKFPEREIAASLCGWICTNIIAADANSFLNMICQIILVRFLAPIGKSGIA